MVGTAPERAFDGRCATDSSPTTAGVSTALYRKYRPQSFDDVVGQDDVVRTLRNAIENEQLRQAYLFSGPRGTGKTSLARILAKALNCEKGPTVAPCGTCASCPAIAAGTSLDVVEMDAASQRGIDDVREIRERAVLQPVSRYKIYILDEAHQLTKDAFNALLKLIEEPPPHLLFVFCTTELDKMLPTVRSRCQTLKFARPRLPDMASVLRSIADAENIEAPDAALAQIAQSARGSFRDAISTFDQLAAATGGVVELPAVLRLLGVVEEDALFRIVDLVVDGDTRGTLTFIEELAEQGQDLGRFVTDMLEHLRRLMLLQHLDEVPAALPVTAESGERLRSQANQLGEGTILRFIDLLAVAVEEEREGGDPRLPLELALVRITRPGADGAPDAVLARIERLERGLDGDGPARPAPPASEAREEAASASSADTVDVAEAPAAAEPLPDPPSTTSTAPPQLGTAELKQLWQQSIVPAIRERSIPTGSVFAEAQVGALEDGELTLVFPPSASFHLKLAGEPKHNALVTRVLGEILGGEVWVRCELNESPPPAAEGVGEAVETASEHAEAADENGERVLAEDASDAATVPNGASDAAEVATDAPAAEDPVDQFVNLLKDTFDAQEVQED